MIASRRTVLLFTAGTGAEVQAFAEAASRAGADVRIVSDRVDALPAALGDGAIAASFARDPAQVDRVRRALDGATIDGVLVIGPGPAWLAAHVARDRNLPFHAPEAVALCADRLRMRGRFLAAGLPTPWFVGVPAGGDDDLGLLARVRFPCLVSASDTAAPGGALRCDSWDAFLDARRSWAAVLDGEGADAGSSATRDLIVEGIVPGRGVVVDGVLEAGALRVFALFEELTVTGPSATTGRLLVSPARMPPEEQHVVAGHVARAALALGLHHGPVHATCRVDGQDIVVLSVAPRPPSARLARALPVVAPDRTRCTFEDALLAHALGRPLDRYGHQAIASGMLALHAAEPGRLVAIEGVDQVGAMSWVTGLEVLAQRGEQLRPGGGRTSVAVVYAQGAQPDDVIATLEAAARRLRVVVDGTPTSSS
ncbi:ATP-grasp domain-containing protein [Luteitalea sp. TBR-22]|uniref:ATP-grasp domain-containing protein n=1 Tax=Luteitalea sp. TBR-22 TaxID=2802971 RepID=UPI001EF7293F|nr:ATP-grasp domain-containing protein [Luteitalea sp. TBR-22]